MFIGVRTLILLFINLELSSESFMVETFLFRSLFYFRISFTFLNFILKFNFHFDESHFHFDAK